MQRNGRVQNICTITGQWSFNDGTSIAIVGKSGRFAAANRLGMNDVYVARDNSVPYCISEDLGLCLTGVTCHSGRGRGKASGAIIFGVDNSIEFVSLKPF
jgi:hypothetical protein